MSIFSKRTEQVVDQKQNREPSYIIGLMVNTRDVVVNSLKNPWFLSTRQMSAVYGDKAALIPDSSKVGLSVISPDYQRPESRKPWTYVGTLIPGVQGKDTGKTEGISAEGLQSTQAVHNYVHMVVNRKETPTGVKIEQRRVLTGLDPNTILPPSEIKKNTINIPESGVTTTTTTEGTVTRTKTTITKPITPWDFDIVEDGTVVPTKARATGSMGSRIQTGTFLIPTIKIDSILNQGRAIK